MSQTTLYIRAGACMDGPDLAAAPFYTCALEPTDCLDRTFFSAAALANAYATTIYSNMADPDIDDPYANLPQQAFCLSSSDTSMLLGEYCENADGINFNDPLGACYDVVNGVYQCAYSAPACFTDWTYLGPDTLLQQGYQCERCNLPSSMDLDFSDLGFGPPPTDPTVGNFSTVPPPEPPSNPNPGFPGDPTEPPPFGFDPTDAPPGDFGGTTPPPPPLEGGTTAPPPEGFNNPTQPANLDSRDDGTNPRDDIRDEFNNLDENEKMEAAAVFGLVVGILVGCCLLLYCQRLCRRCCGRRSDGIEKGHMAVGAGEYTDDENDLEDRML